MTKELALFLALFFVGLAVMPFAVYFVGEQLFGDYGGDGYAGFFGTLSEKIRSGDRIAWFLALAPYLVWQILRLTAFGWRMSGRAGTGTPRS